MDINTIREKIRTMDKRFLYGISVIAAVVEIL
jgi:hypothetical protein